MSTPLLSIVLPVYNQAAHIVETALHKPPYRHEMLLVVNGCRDHSLDVCQAMHSATQHCGYCIAPRVVGNVQYSWVCRRTVISCVIPIRRAPVPRILSCCCSMQ